MDCIAKIDGVLLTPLKIIPGEKGSVFHSLRNFDPGFSGFGEAYFSTVNKGAIKAWKKHSKMILNLTVPIGEVKVVLFDDRENSLTKGIVQEFNLSLQNYYRITIPPGIWFGFEGISDGINMLLNIASIPHEPDEHTNLDISECNFPYKWSQNQ
jgi:dTDP-4-dehydrorhamnose 3,5-epimerase